MSSRLAQLAARLDALSRIGAAAEEPPRVARWGGALVIPLPPAVVEALALREGEQIEVRALDRHSLQIMVTRQLPDPALPR